MINIQHFFDALARRRDLRAFGRRARARANQRQEIAIVQSCDEAYVPLLDVTGRVNRQYADRHSYIYADFVGNASPAPSTANFNRYFLMRELISLRHIKWALWLDADAIVIDHARRLESIIQESADKMLIICRGRPGGRHTINNGVFFLNLRHPMTASMLRYVIGVCRVIPRRNRRFCSDQRHMHSWLLQHQSRNGEIPLMNRYSGEESDLFNYSGNFIRHVLRARGRSIEERVQMLTQLSPRVRSESGLS